MVFFHENEDIFQRPPNPRPARAEKYPHSRYIL